MPDGDPMVISPGLVVMAFSRCGVQLFRFQHDSLTEINLELLKAPVDGLDGRQGEMKSTLSDRGSSSSNTPNSILSLLPPQQQQSLDTSASSFIHRTPLHTGLGERCYASPALRPV
ncbi:hypothetical protein RRG08_015450 [Elysia crispata]|uniref:Uncharacterized protein n=1 Tax=Elysia crispata TaxID=231223 RepID=A0AAE0YHL8_9GAST|nr:hypothetical protein RRG08_015450 [Elysia crispata]